MTSDRAPGPRLSVLVVARDEELHLAKALGCVKFADEIVVVLDRCTDQSAEIASSYTNRILTGAWPLEGDRRNAGLEMCTGDWILEVDADERVTDSLAQEIRQAIASAEPNTYYRIPFDNYIGTHLVRYGWGGHIGVLSSPRLFPRGAKRWENKRIHPKTMLQGKPRDLEQRMIHLADRDISDLIRRVDRYATQRAADLRDSGHTETIWRNLRRIASRFWRCYVVRRGYREGYRGLLIALLAAVYPLLSYLKAKLKA